MNEKQPPKAKHPPRQSVAEQIAALSNLIVLDTAEMGRLQVQIDTLNKESTTILRRCDANTKGRDTLMRKLRYPGRTLRC